MKILYLGFFLLTIKNVYVFDCMNFSKDKHAMVATALLTTSYYGWPDK
jgi:hypothetical protein